jgi:hypothetical protein
MMIMNGLSKLRSAFCTDFQKGVQFRNSVKNLPVALAFDSVAGIL